MATRILESLGPAKANFKIVATNVRPGDPGKHYLLEDGAKLPALIAKWIFDPKADPLSRCGYDYQILATNGDVTLPLSICFRCNTLVVNHRERYRTSRKEILALLTADFQPLN